MDEIFGNCYSTFVVESTSKPKTQKSREKEPIPSTCGSSDSAGNNQDQVKLNKSKLMSGNQGKEKENIPQWVHHS